MHALAVASSPQSDARATQPPAARQPAATERLLALQLAQRPATARALQRCGGHDEALEDELRMGAQALQRAVADRRMVARDGQDPGPPQAPDMQGLGCGFNSKGEWTCSAETGKGALELDPKSIPSTAPPTLPNRPPASCPTDRWNWFSSKCCPEGQYFDQSQRKCASTNKEAPVPIRPFDLGPTLPLPPSSPAPFVVPPAPEPPPKGDFPLPGGDQMYA